MKYFLLFTLTLCSIKVFSQLQLNSIGYASIGGYSPATSIYELTTGDAKFNQTIYVMSTATFSSGATLYGGTYFRDMSRPDISNIRISTEYNGSWYFTGINPTLNNSSRIGSSSFAFNAIYSYSFVTVSDSRLKENIKVIEGGLDIIKSLNGVRYDLKNNSENLNPTPSSKAFDLDRKNKVGLIAQDVLKVLPEAVFHDDSTDIYAIDYTKIIPVLVEAMKEQQTIIESLQKQVLEIKNHKKEGNGISDQSEVTVALDQNFPNPFDRETTISFSLPKHIQTASIFIYDLNGAQLKSIELTDRGASSRVTIQAGEFNAGMYLYTLVADGHVADTKRMILTK